MILLVVMHMYTFSSLVNVFNKLLHKTLIYHMVIFLSTHLKKKGNVKIITK